MAFRVDMAGWNPSAGVHWNRQVRDTRLQNRDGAKFLLKVTRSLGTGLTKPYLGADLVSSLRIESSFGRKVHSFASQPWNIEMLGLIGLVESSEGSGRTPLHFTGLRSVLPQPVRTPGRPFEGVSVQACLVRAQLCLFLTGLD